VKASKKSSQEVYHQGQYVKLVPTEVRNLKKGDSVIGPCGHERIVREIEVDGFQYQVAFKGTAKKWYRSSDEEVLVVVRKYEK